MYYLAMVTTGKERGHYVDLSQKAAYFCLSWYYTWDVPFAQGQMLGDVNFKSRGWGNVSVENNHIDVFIFEFATVLDWLAKEKNNARFADFAAVFAGADIRIANLECVVATVGSSGASALRFSLVTASARSRPALAWGMPVGSESNSTCVCPAIRSGMASAVPL